MKAVFLGEQGSGKTQLINRIQGFPFQKDYFPTRFARYVPAYELEIWDLSGDEQYKNHNGFYYRHAKIVVYCVDLSEDINTGTIQRELTHLLHYSSDATILLVGTKADLCMDSEEKLQKLRQELAGGDIREAFVTSSLYDEGTTAFVDYLKKLPAELAKEQETELARLDLSLWQQAEEQLRQEISRLPYNKYLDLKNEISILKGSLEKAETLLQKEEAIQNFNKQCHQILEGKYPVIYNSLLTLSAVAAVTVIAGLIGFGIGFAAGAWTGPGAFFTGLIAAHTAATAVVAVSASLGLLTGGLTAYGFFKQSKESAAVDNFVATMSASNNA
ncbi:ADP-ribosylation factor-like protein [Legionella cardiaca]|uniref:ADP-ribosylation factor-like protein n=1 Tax=Legionella cardiaca TaxID=1071983 RepID=A0ABY8AZL4_9GAMM|nr:ADP-ribosylation factor-like protein [Legionella cardiaca]WED44562.1 ADP-ribosylation factor-like protein [Legionella cardiaca]